MESDDHFTDVTSDVFCFSTHEFHAVFLLKYNTICHQYFKFEPFCQSSLEIKQSSILHHLDFLAHQNLINNAFKNLDLETEDDLEAFYLNLTIF